MSLTALEPLAIPEIYCDGLTDISIINGIFRCVFYTLQQALPDREPVKVAVVKIVIPASEVPSAACAAFSAVTKHNIAMLFGTQTAAGC